MAVIRIDIDEDTIALLKELARLCTQADQGREGRRRTAR